jgi:hypothetical protein
MPREHCIIWAVLSVVSGHLLSSMVLRMLTYADVCWQVATSSDRADVR